MRDDPMDDGWYDLGVPALDAEHRGEIDRTNRLVDAIRAGTPPRQLAGELATLIDYLEAHFLSEQIMMREQAYAGYEAHQAEHDEAIALLRTIHARFLADDVAASSELMRSLRHWLLDHIQTTDRAFAAHLAARR